MQLRTIICFVILLLVQQGNGSYVQLNETEFFQAATSLYNYTVTSSTPGNLAEPSYTLTGGGMSLTIGTSVYFAHILFLEIFNLVI
jgi:hypothetical protein